MDFPERDKAIGLTVIHQTWQYFYDWTLENDIPQSTISCPREKMAIVMFCHVVLLRRLPGYNDPDTLIQKDERDILRELHARGFAPAADNLGLINLNEDNRAVRIPDSWQLFDEDQHGRHSSAATEGGGGSELAGTGSSDLGTLSGSPVRGPTPRRRGPQIPVRRENG